MISMIGLEDKPFLLIHISFSRKHLDFRFSGGVRYFNFINNHSSAILAVFFLKPLMLLQLGVKSVVRFKSQVRNKSHTKWAVGPYQLQVWAHNSTCSNKM